MTRQTLIAGNWKMHGLTEALGFFGAIAPIAAKSPATVLVCPPATLLQQAARACDGTVVRVGGQDCHAAPSGAHTGDISAAMLRDAGATHVILGHSERRADHGERDADIRAKAEAALAAGLVPVICVGETLSEREAGREVEIVAGQLAGSLPENAASVDLVIAYEPVWAIGTGLTASVADVASMHAAIRERLPNPATSCILYGGSVKPDNAAELLGLADVDGALVGGASLNASDFTAIIEAASRKRE
ncbi:triose-phosphate isomerase [Maricaulis maris]|uniref:Triosephosphate isomerase n=1 Tax=Maricaulis maris TaxID=74318 RepID=A0A495DJG4_9PROT|nr:triose-phosphate isomerase [Maricaulis maris]RKR02763.1 triosephosphate isomerase [Maricaulis maris]